MLLLVGIGGNMPTTPRQDKDNKLAETPNDMLEAADGVIQSEYFIMHDKGVDPRAAVEGHDQ
jgi:hypothetical protein